MCNVVEGRAFERDSHSNSKFPLFSISMCLALNSTLYLVSFNTQNNSPDTVLILFFPDEEMECSIPLLQITQK